MKLIKKIITRLINNINNLIDKMMASKRRKKLKSIDFSIISNNCWGGKVYNFFNIQYLTPTIGLFFPPSDFLRFCKNMHYYLSIKIEFIEYSKSRNIELINEKIKNGVFKFTPIIGVLDDVEIIFLHYKSINEAEQKWNRRLKRISSKNIIFKMNDNNGFNDDDFSEWKQLKTAKIFITNKKKYLDDYNSFYIDSKLENESGVDDVKHYKKMDIISILNDRINS